MKPLLLTIALLIALAIPATSHADYWQLNIKRKCPAGWVLMQYKFRTLAKARIYMEIFRREPKYRNCWIRYVRE